MSRTRGTDASGPEGRPWRDVRMRGFVRRVSVEAAQEWVDSETVPLDSELIDLNAAVGRVLASSITSDYDVPGFDRAMMDGFAVRADDSCSASMYNPRTVRVIGEVLPGRQFMQPLTAGEAVRIMTGAPMPPGADTVVPAEKTEQLGDQVQILEELPPQKHVGPRGEDIRAGAQVMAAGRRLRPQDIGVLSSIGIASASVVRRPRVRIVITGNELLPSGSQPADCRIVDANGPMLQALVSRDGGVVTSREIIEDQPDRILEAMQDDVDVVIVSGGSSVGVEDYAPRLLAEHGQLAIHGIAMRPSSPTGMGRLGGRQVFLLPGNPVSCLCAYDFFAGRAIRQLGGRPTNWPYPSRRATLRRKLVSQVGRVDYARVAWHGDQLEPIAISGASMLSSTSRADGFIVVPADLEGYAPGSVVTVWCYDA